MRLLLTSCLLLAACAVQAKVPPEEAAQLRAALTPLGAERAGNADGTIPPWTGGLAAPPPCHQPGTRYCDPYAAERPYVTITADNLHRWRGALSAGQIEMFARHPGYRLPVYPTRRSFANPPAVYEAAHRNALHAVVQPSGVAVNDSVLAVPFPIPKSGVEPIWNHRLRYRGPGYSRWVTQATVSASGDAHLVRLREDADFPYARAEADAAGVAQRWLQTVLFPERLQGSLTLVHDTLDADSPGARAWRQHRRGQEAHRIRSARAFGFDNPALLADDLRFDDQLDTYFGSPECYTWRIVGKREQLVPYNSYRLHSGREGLLDVLQPGHPDPAYMRYELHRVWVVEATLKPKLVHRAKRRTFYIDEDSWQILMVDLYDRHDRLWRWQEVHTLMAYDRAILMPAMEAIYELDSRRYLLQGIDQGQAESIETVQPADYFTPAGARAAAR